MQIPKLSSVFPVGDSCSDVLLLLSDGALPSQEIYKAGIKNPDEVKGHCPFWMIDTSRISSYLAPPDRRTHVPCAVVEAGFCWRGDPESVFKWNDNGVMCESFFIQHLNQNYSRPSLHTFLSSLYRNTIHTGIYLIQWGELSCQAMFHCFTGNVWLWLWPQHGEPWKKHMGGKNRKFHVDGRWKVPDQKICKHPVCHLDVVISTTQR